jgi:hypothetical protein
MNLVSGEAVLASHHSAGSRGCCLRSEVTRSADHSSSCGQSNHAGGAGRLFEIGHFEFKCLVPTEVALSSEPVPPIWRECDTLALLLRRGLLINTNILRTKSKWRVSLLVGRRQAALPQPSNGVNKTELRCRAECDQVSGARRRC